MNRLPLDQFRSQEERFFYRMVRSFPQLVEEFREWQVERVVYEGMTFQLGEVKYTPDFNITLVNGMLIADELVPVRALVQVEVKGSKHQKGYEMTRAKLAIAASSFPEYTWMEVRVDGRKFVFDAYEFISKRPLVYLAQTIGV